jgi:ferredoxin
VSAGLRVRFLPAGREVRVPRGTFLTTAAARACVDIVHDCDGQGVCGTCRIRIEDGGAGFGPPDPREVQQLGAWIEDGWRLCCLLVVGADCEVRVPVGAFAYPPEQQRASRPDDHTGEDRRTR